ncbi:hypothetical protein [Plebeiibacterium marinum]|uniref:Periplasmic heavy metal sensor n=1 Tax=Plebeiibacterium marinum TaxID=2992111 RepID=A0AAE3MEB0_9BACT|nr:hypothetical protein [Plebeiobacterium marinum]MCW3806233.1 hypothetical protein [Plebeiobacterium marinum]
MKNRYYHIIIGLLIVLNVFSWRFWWEKPKVPSVIEQIKHRKDNRHEGKNAFFEELQLTPDQQAEFEKQRKSYFKEIGELNAEIENSRRLLIESYENNGSAGDSLFEVLGRNKMLIEKATFNHFKSLREVCNDDQKEGFDSITSMMVKRFHRWDKRRGDKRGVK